MSAITVILITVLILFCETTFIWNMLYRRHTVTLDCNNFKVGTATLGGTNHKRLKIPILSLQKSNCIFQHSTENVIQCANNSLLHIFIFSLMLTFRCNTFLCQFVLTNPTQYTNIQNHDSMFSHPHLCSLGVRSKALVNFAYCGSVCE